MKRLLISMTILALLVVPQFACGGDVDDLKAANEKLIEAWRALDAEGITSLISPGIVAYLPGAAFPLVSQVEAYNEAGSVEYMKTILENLEYYNMTYYNPGYRVFGNTGMAWGHVTISNKEKGQPAHTQFLRYTLTWIKSDGKWLLAMSHYSPIPTGD